MMAERVASLQHFFPGALNVVAVGGGDLLRVSMEHSRKELA